MAVKKTAKKTAAKAAKPTTNAAAKPAKNLKAGRAPSKGDAVLQQGVAITRLGSDRGQKKVAEPTEGQFDEIEEIDGPDNDGDEDDKPAPPTKH